MVTTTQAAAIISRGNDPQGEGFGIPAVASYSFFGGTGAFTPAEQAAVKDAMRMWSDVAHISFFVDNDDPEIGFKNYRKNDNSTGGTTGPYESRNGEHFLALNPDTTVRVGLNLVNTPGTALSQGGADRQTLIHEVGHAIGLSHPGKYNAGSNVPIVAAYPEDSLQYTQMSYLSETSTGANFKGSFSRTPSLDDIAAAQRLYGANMATRTDDTTYGFNSNAGAAFLISSANEKAVFTVWDAKGNDTLDFSGYANKQLINLDLESFSDVGGLKKNIAIAAAVDTAGLNSWEANFDPNSIANYVENAIGGSGTDTINGNLIANRLEGRNGDDFLNGFAGKDSLYGGDDKDELNGGADSDALRGERGDDYLIGGAGIDDLYGGDGRDTLDGGFNGKSDGVRDVMQGGAGNDKYLVTDTTDMVLENVGGVDLGDKVFTSLRTYSLQQSNYLQGEVENLAFTGTGNFTATGNALANTISGGDGNDKISGLEGDDVLNGAGGKDQFDGGSGTDTLNGGSGNDVYFLFDVKNGHYDRVVEAAGGGVDQIQVRDVDGSVRSYTLADNVEIGAIVGAEADQFTLIGNKSDNHLFDDVGDNILIGGGGDDTLNGGGFYGGDVLMGGVGNDVYELDYRRGNYDYVDEAANEGRDTVLVTAFHEEDEHYTDTYTLTDNVENGEIRGAIDFGLYGNELDNRLFGNDAANMLSGLDGNDTLTGGLGDDQLIGGSGNDKYFLYDLIGGSTPEELNHYDAVVEEADGGIDTVVVIAIDDPQSFADGYALTEYVENGTIGGSLSFYLQGNDFDNVLRGNDAENTLYGYEGNDTLIGGGGADVLDGGTGENTASYAFATAGLFAGLEDANANSGEALGDSYINIQNLIGSNYDDILYGTDGVNKFSGGDGKDLMIGKGSGDILDGGNGSDTVGYDADYTGVTADLMDSSKNTGTGAGDIYISIENLDGSTFNDLLYGDNNDNIIEGNVYHFGESGSDRIWGRGGDDTLKGHDNADTLIGGVGNDLLYGGTGADHFVFDATLTPGNADTIKDFEAGDRLDLDSSVFAGLSVGALASAAFKLIASGSSTTGVDNSDRILYDKADGDIYFDRDGSGDTYDRVLFASITNGTSLDQLDFEIV